MPSSGLPFLLLSAAAAIFSRALAIENLDNFLQSEDQKQIGYYVIQKIDLIGDGRCHAYTLTSDSIMG